MAAVANETGTLIQKSLNIRGDLRESNVSPAPIMRN